MKINITSHKLQLKVTDKILRVFAILRIPDLRVYHSQMECPPTLAQHPSLRRSNRAAQVKSADLSSSQESTSSSRRSGRRSKAPAVVESPTWSVSAEAESSGGSMLSPPGRVGVRKSFTGLKEMEKGKVCGSEVSRTPD